ncbi:hypothetical protein QEN19_001008 [Hanseniaspora menglaensis]
MSFISGNIGETSQNSTSGRRNILPYNPDDEDLGPSVSMAVMADNDQDFKKSTFGIKRTTSVGKFGIKTNKNLSISPKNHIKPYSSQPLIPPLNKRNSFSPHLAVSNLAPQPIDKPNYTSPLANYTPQDISISSTPEPQRNAEINMYNSNDNIKSNFSHDPVYIQPRDDVDLYQEPSRHVDYFSHNWDESDISKSWKYIILQKKKKKQTENNDNLGMHHQDDYSRSGSVASHSGTPQSSSFNPSSKTLTKEAGHDENDESSDLLKLTTQLHDLEIDMDAINASRLENASWRTWAKARNNLKTVSPEIVNWCKEADDIWLFGPIVPGKNIISSSQNNLDSADAAIQSVYDKDKNRSTNTSDGILKPILKKRTVTEVIERNAKWKLNQIKKNYMKTHRKLPIHRLEEAADLRSHSPMPFGNDKEKDDFLYPHEDYNALAAKVNAQYYKKSGSQQKKTDEKLDDSMNNRKKVMATLLSTEKSSPSSANLKILKQNNNINVGYNNFENQVTSPKYQSNSPVIKGFQVPINRHIRFNDRVEQCIAVIPDDFNNSGIHKTNRGLPDEEDTRRIRKRSKIVLPSGITLGTGNGGSSDESTSDDDDDDTFYKPSLNISDEDDNSPQFIEHSNVENDKPDYTLGNTRYYRGPALSVSDSSDECEDDGDDIVAIGKSANTYNTNSNHLLNNDGLFMDTMRPKYFFHGLSSTPPARTIERPAINRLNTEPACFSKPKYPPAIKRLPATSLNYKKQDAIITNDSSKNNERFDQHIINRNGGISDSHGYNNYDYNSVFTKGFILQNNAGINVVDVPSQFVPSQPILAKTNERKNASEPSFFSENNFKRAKSDSNFNIKTGMASKGTLSRSSSATSGLVQGFAANLHLNSSSDLRKPNFIKGKPASKSESSFLIMGNNDDDDSDDESEDEKMSITESLNSSSANINNNSFFSSTVAGKNYPSSSVFLNNKPDLLKRDSSSKLSFTSDINISDDFSEDFGAPLSKLLSRTDSQLSLGKSNSRLNIAGRFSHNLRPPPKKSFSFYEDGNDSDSE